MSSGLSILRAIAFPRFQVWKLDGVIYLVPRPAVGIPYTADNVPGRAVFSSRKKWLVEEYIYHGLSVTNTDYLDAKVRRVVQVLLCKKRDKFYKKMEMRYAGTK